jgi:aminoglycoside phosphotransferase (APT) family kinase protein
VTTPNGPAAGVHLPWAEVPVAVRTWAAGVGGGAPSSVRDLSGGFSPGAVTVLDCPQRAVFVKAVGATLNPESPDFHRREAVVSASLPPAPQLPRLLSVYDDGDWVALAFEAIDGRPPAHPWDEGELESAVRALDALHHVLTPNPVPDAPSAAVRLQHVFGGWAELAALDRVPEGLDDWSRRNLDRLADLESGWQNAVAGTTLLHCDVRSDNLLVTSGGVVFVDWPHACVGAPALDLVAWAPSVVLEGGPAPEALLGLSPVGSFVERAALAVMVAAFSGFLVCRSLQPSPPGLPTLRGFQAAQGAVALDWLRRVTDW